MMKEKNYNDPWLPERWSATEELLRKRSWPLITIGVLNYNRLPFLMVTLEVLTKGVEYPNKEIILVDNGSTDGSIEAVAKSFPEVRIISLKENIGTCARNEFFKHAKGEYVFSYDDDSMPATPATLLHLVDFLEDHKDIDVINMFCWQPITEIVETAGFEHFYLRKQYDGYVGVYAVEGGMGFRRSALASIKGFDDRLFWGAEGADLSLQLYSANKVIFYHPGYATLHLKAFVNRSVSTNARWVTRNYIYTITKHFPKVLSPFLIVLYIARRTVTALHQPVLRQAIAQGIRDGIMQCKEFYKERPKLSLQASVMLKRWFLLLYRW